MKNPSRRARRMERHHRLAKGSPLNLVSLMDIFTILVFFLLVNSSNAPELPRQKDLALPKSTAKKAPQDTLILTVTQEIVLLQGKEVARVADVQATSAEVIEPLRQELEFWRSNRQLRARSSGQETGAAITIMGDENISYALLHKILTTCQQANYTDIAFAAHQLTNPEPSAPKAQD
jgi:biopolymer transport protein ExbD